jgi:hypothetical protein
MSKTKYCINCKQSVRPVKRFRWGLFIGGLLLTAGLLSVIYLFYFWFQNSKYCPICKDNLNKQKNPATDQVPG